MYLTYETLLEMPRKPWFLSLFESFFVMEKDEILQVNLHCLRYAAISIHMNIHR